MTRAVIAVALAVSVQGSVFRVPVPVRVQAQAQTQTPERRTPSPEPASVRVGFLRGDGSYAITEIPLESYVARVVAGEAARDSRPAALEALAITVRTFARANRGRHRADGFDLCDQTHCQVVRTATAATARAAAATDGQVLLHGGVPATVYYSASCGGHTSAPSEVWPGHEDLPYLPSRRDDACERAPEWDVELRANDLVRALRAAGFRGSLHAIHVTSHTPSGRVARLRLDGMDPNQISGQDLRVAVGRTLGWQYIKSTDFDLRARADVYRFSGHGSGHGVGLCVIGSTNLAERGQSAAQILARYFPGLAIGGDSVRAPITTAATPSRPAVPGSTSVPAAAAASRAVRGAPSSDVVVSLPDEDEGDRSVIQREIVRARDDLARTLGVPPPPPRVVVRFHATTDDYERDTGRAWFTSGAIVSGELHLLPLATLRDRGVLERTIRHELVHLMADTPLAGRPAWVREGAAIYFAGAPSIAGDVQRPPFKPDPRAACPTDGELLRPVSAGALANGSARARACFAKQIAAGRSWRDVR